MGGPREVFRTCVGCRAAVPKRVLLRVARAPGGVRLDPVGNLPGRGVYVHRNTECVEAAMSRGTLARALQASLDAGEAARLRAEIERELT